MANVGNITVFNNFYEGSDLAVINAGMQKKADHSFGPYTNNYHVLQYILDGQGTLVIGGEEYRLVKNTLFYLPANVSCKYYADKNDPYEYYWVSFIGERSERILQKCRLSNRIPVRHLESPEVRNLFMRIFRNIHSNKADHTYRILSDLYAIFACLSEAESDQMEGGSSAFINSVLAYMHANYPYGININDVCKHMYMNLSYFSELFTRETGINPSKYLMGIRMSNGAMLLKTTDLKICEIALRVGMTPLAFTSAFKKHYHYTPKAYRDRSEKTVHNE